MCSWWYGPEIRLNNSGLLLHWAIFSQILHQSRWCTQSIRTRASLTSNIQTFWSGLIRSTSRPAASLMLKTLQQLHLILGSRKLPVVSDLLHHLNVPDVRILGGSEATPNSWPFLVSYSMKISDVWNYIIIELVCCWIRISGWSEEIGIRCVLRRNNHFPDANPYGGSLRH